MGEFLDGVKSMFGMGGTTPSADPEKPTEPPADPLAWDKKKAAEWKGRIDRAQARKKDIAVWWDAAMKEYAPRFDEQPDTYRLRVRTNRPFSIVERKIGDLFYQRPDVSVAPSPLLEELAVTNPAFSALPTVHSHILNEKLGLDGVDAVGLMSTALFDKELCGAGWTDMGYESYTKPMPQTVTDPDTPGPIDPMTGQPTVIPGAERIEVVDVPVKSNCYWENVSPKAVLIPTECRGTDYDKQAAWLGLRFTISLNEAKRKWGAKIPENFKPSGPKQGEDYFDHGGNASPSGTTDLCAGTRIWYKSSLFRDDIIHPDHLTLLIFLDGIKDPVDEKDSPHQEFDAQGRLTPDSLIGFPLHPIVVRKLTDSPYIMSDVGVIMPQTQEMDVFREQCVEQRRINLTRFAHNTDEITNDELKAAMNAPQGGSIGLPAKAFSSGRLPLRPFEIAPIPPDDWAFNATQENDLSQTMGIDATAQGVAAGGSETATKTGVLQNNRNVRAGKEANTVAACYIKGVTKFSTLIQRYLTPEDAAAIVGQQRAMLWDAWRKEIPTRLAFTMLPDSQLRNDTPLDRKQFMDTMTYAANDPNINRRYMWQEYFRKCHIDETRALLPPEQVPQPKPEQPKPSVAFKGEDFNPMLPQSPIMMDLFQKITNLQIDPEAVKNALALAQLVTLMNAQAQTDGAADQKGQPAHGGKLAQMESLDKHHDDKSGGMQGSGQLLPQMGGPTGVN